MTDDLELGVSVDEPRALMLEELEEEFGDEKIKRVIEANVVSHVHTVINRIYDNQDQIKQLEDETE